MIDSESTILTPPVSSRDHTLGPKNAPITLLEFGDYECPYCQAAEPIIGEVLRQMDNQIRFAFRNFPLVQSHPYALPAAEAAETAGDQAKFWPMHNLLYQNQEALTYEDLLRYAEELGLNMQQFEEALRDHEYLARIEEDMRSGLESGVEGTPTFFINGRLYAGPTEVRPMISVIRRLIR